MRGFESPNHTQIPNDLFEVHLPDLSLAELKILLILLRQTLGFHRRQTRISFRQLEEMTGLSGGSIHSAYKKLIKKELVEKTSDGGVTLWKVYWRDEEHPPDMGVLGVSKIDTPKSKRGYKNKDTSSQKMRQSVSKIDTPSIKESIKEKDKEIKSSKNQSDWIMALAHLRNHKYNGTAFHVQEQFTKYWQPTEVHSEENGRIIIKCLGEDPEYQKAWLEDRGEGVAEKALIAVTGNRIEVEYVLKGE